MPTGPSLLENRRLNPGYLKLDLFCKGLRLADDFHPADGGDTRTMRAGLGSGIELRLPRSGGMCVNAPVNEEFASGSPYELHGPLAGGRPRLFYGGRELGPVEVPATPRFYARQTSSGKPMGSVGVIQGTYLGVYYGMLCANWKHPSGDACRFCALGLSVSEGAERTDKTPLDVVETARAARRELGITFVHLNGGFDDRGDYLGVFGPALERLRGETGLLTGLQVPPLPHVQQYQKFRQLGVNNVSLCFEVWDPERFEEVCPGKNRRVGLDRFRVAIEYCAQEVRFDTTNGELIAGLEDPGNSMAAVDWLTSVGAIPTVCVFRPVRGTPYADLPPPAVEDMVPVFAHTYRRCMERGLPIGIAPKVHVSIVMTPEECRWLLPPAERSRWRLRRLKHAALRAALGLAVRRRAAAAGVKAERRGG